MIVVYGKTKSEQFEMQSRSAVLRLLTHLSVLDLDSPKLPGHEILPLFKPFRDKPQGGELARAVADHVTNALKSSSKQHYKRKKRTSESRIRGTEAQPYPL